MRMVADKGVYRDWLAPKIFAQARVYQDGYPSEIRSYALARQ